MSARVGVGAVARMRMSMRVRVLRAHADDVVPARDAWGAEVPDPVLDVLHDQLACFAWVSEEDAEQLDEAVGVFGVVRMIVPHDADVREGDVVQSVSDRLGRVLFAGPMRIIGVSRRATHRVLIARVQQPGGA